MNSQTTDRLKERAWPILLRLIIIAVALLVTTLISTVKANAQIVVANPLEWAVLVEGNELIDGQIKNETEGMTRTAVLQSTIAAEFSGIKSWEKKYNAYLKSADGFASSIKAATYLYNDGVRLFINLSDIRKAIAANPQGLAATLSMNNLYIETATELVSVYSALKEAVAIVPASIISTFQLMAFAAPPSGSIPSATNTAAAASAMIQRFSENISSSTYMAANSISASSI